jgi:hypothetical protein
VGIIKAAGKWDSTMFVLTADHGISFLPTLPQRNTDFTDLEQSEDIYRIPMFMKFPGQTVGKVDDCPVTNLDILPTVNDVLGTTSSWSFDGMSVREACPSRGGRQVVAATGEKHTVTTGFAAARERADYYSMLVPNTGPVSRIAAVGQSAGLVGLPVPAAAQSTLVGSWTLRQRDAFAAIDGRPGTTVPATVTGTVTLSGPAVANSPDRRARSGSLLFSTSHAWGRASTRSSSTCVTRTGSSPASARRPDPAGYDAGRGHGQTVLSASTALSHGEPRPCGPRHRLPPDG